MAWWEIPVASASPSSVNEANDRAYPIGLGFPGGSNSKEFTCNAGDPGSILDREDPLEKGMATHSSILAWKIS